MIKFFDSHAHIESISFGDNLEEVIKRAREGGVEYIINIGSSSDFNLWEEVLSISKKYPFIKYSVGIHPHEAKNATSFHYEKLKNFIKSNSPVAIGETGLDAYYKFSPIEIQEDCFRKQIEIAKIEGLPLLIHCRDAHKTCIEILKENNTMDIGGVIHCFSGDLNDAREYIDLGFYISVGGTVTFKKSEKIKEVVQEIPLERLLIETDSPYLAPEPFRGRKNEPSFIKWTAEKIAELKNTSTEQIAKITNLNAKKLFRKNCLKN